MATILGQRASGREMTLRLDWAEEAVLGPARSGGMTEPNCSLRWCLQHDAGMVSQQRNLMLDLGPGAIGIVAAVAILAATGSLFTLSHRRIEPTEGIVVYRFGRTDATHIHAGGRRSAVVLPSSIAACVSRATLPRPGRICGERCRGRGGAAARVASLPSQSVPLAHQWQPLLPAAGVALRQE